MPDIRTARVNVLLSTYNGETYLRPLLESLDNQSHPAEWITIRDDGSMDGTYPLATGFAATHPNVRLTTGNRLGVAQSFFALLKGADRSCDYFAFCDQDDVWGSTKLEDAVETLAHYGPEEPLLYCSAIEYVDASLQHLCYSRQPRVLNFANALVENVATGCTIVLNAKAREILTEHLPCMPVAHDWWCYLVVSAFGTVIYDPRPNVKYRLHQGNAVGAALGHWRQFHRRLARFWSCGLLDLKFAEQAQQFYECFSTSLHANHRKTLKRFLDVQQSWQSRIAYAIRMGVVRQSKLDMAILRLLISLGRV